MQISHTLITLWQLLCSGTQYNIPPIFQNWIFSTSGQKTSNNCSQCQFLLWQLSQSQSVKFITQADNYPFKDLSCTMYRHSQHTHKYLFFSVCVQDGQNSQNHLVLTNKWARPQKNGAQQGWCHHMHIPYYHKLYCITACKTNPLHNQIILYNCM